MLVPRGKFTTDLLWNVGAFGLVAVTGVLINLLIVRGYDAAALGAFNQVYALYILLSQLAVGGVHLAVQAFVPRALQDGKAPDTYVSAALILATLSSLLVMLLCWWGREVPGRWFQSEGVRLGFQWVIPGLLFFSWNKVLLSFHNGARRMKLFAAFQLLRFVFMFTAVAFMYWWHRPAHELPMVLSVAEAVLLLVVLPVSLRYWSLRKLEGLRGSLVTSFRFGNRALPGNMLLDVNTRVDVFLLGIFLSDRWVGLYSFAATVAEGVMQLPMLIRNNINPVLTRAWNQGGPTLTQRVIKRNRRLFFRTLAPLVLVTIPLFPLALWILGMKDEPMLVWSLYAILAAGIALTAGYLPFQMIFNQLERPGRQTLFIFLGFLSNVILNLLLIPIWGVHGSAAGTALSFLLSVIFFRGMTRSAFHIRA